MDGLGRGGRGRLPAHHAIPEVSVAVPVRDIRAARFFAAPVGAIHTCVSPANGCAGGRRYCGAPGVRGGLAAIGAFAAALAGEWLGRWLFFVSVVPKNTAAAFSAKSRAA